MVTFLRKYLLGLSLLVGFASWAQNDTIRLKNNDVIVGETKNLNTGLLTIETSYSDKDFIIEFDKVDAIIIQRRSVISLTGGRRYFGKIRSNSLGKITITSEDGKIEEFKIDELVGLVEVNNRFWKRFKGTLDVAFNFTKANNNAQFTTSGTLNYKGEKWLLKGNINILNSAQDSIVDVKRTDALVEVLRLLPEKWYMSFDVSFLSNTEQALDARTSPGLAFGRLLKSTNKLYLGVALGLTYNSENYVDPSLDKTSAEAVFNSSFNMYNFKDFDLTTNLKFYVSLTEKGRIRTDYDITVKYDLPWDFYIKAGFTLNYDNQPAVSGTDLDYIFTSGFGYKFD